MNNKGTKGPATTATTINSLSPADKYDILREYIKNTTLTEVANKYSVPMRTIETFISKFYKEFTTSKELHSLLSNHSALPKFKGNFKKPSYISEELMKKIEEEDADLIYAHSYHLTKDNIQSLKEAGLFNLHRIHCSSEVNSNADKLKGQYLRSIPRVQEELKRLREQSLANSNVNSDYIRSSLLEQLEQLNNYEYLGTKERQLLLRTLELLGKSVGAYSDKVIVETVDPNTALDKLINMTTAKDTLSPTYVMEG